MYDNTKNIFNYYLRKRKQLLGYLENALAYPIEEVRPYFFTLKCAKMDS